MCQFEGSPDRSKADHWACFTGILSNTSLSTIPICSIVSSKSEQCADQNCLSNFHICPFYYLWSEKPGLHTLHFKTCCCNFPQINLQLCWCQQYLNFVANHLFFHKIFRGSPPQAKGTTVQWAHRHARPPQLNPVQICDHRRKLSGHDDSSLWSGLFR